MERSKILQELADEAHVSGDDKYKRKGNLGVAFCLVVFTLLNLLILFARLILALL